MKKHMKKIILAIVLLIMIVPMIMEMYDKNSSQGITYDEFKGVLENKEDALVYFDSEKSPVKKTMINNLKVIGNSEMQMKHLDYDAMSEDEKIELVGLNDQILDGPAFAFISKGEIVAVRNGAYSGRDLTTLFNKYFSGAEEDINYKVAGSAKDFIDVAAKEKIVMLVLGRTSCSYCEAYRPVYNDLATKYDIDMYYFDSDYYDNDEFGKLMRENYTIPGFSSSMKNPDGNNVACTDNGEDAKISAGYGTPLTLFIKDGKTIDCISGLVENETLISVLQFHKIPKKK